MSIVYSDVLTPDGLTDEQAELLREDLSDSSLHTLADLLRNNAEAARAFDLSTLTSGVGLEIRPGKLVFTCPYSVFLIDELTLQVPLCGILAGTKVTGCAVTVDVEAAGTAGTVLADVGITTTDDNGFVVGADAEAEGIYGGSEAETGALLKTAALVQNGYLVQTDGELSVTLTSSSGDLDDLTIGEFRVAIAYEFMG